MWFAGPNVHGQFRCPLQPLERRRGSSASLILRLLSEERFLFRLVEISIPRIHTHFTSVQLPLDFVIELFLVSYHVSPRYLLHGAISAPSSPCLFPPALCFNLSCTFYVPPLKRAGERVTSASSRNQLSALPPNQMLHSFQVCTFVSYTTV